MYVPMRGPRLYIAMADALSRSENKSPTDPPPTAIGALPDKPADIHELEIEKSLGMFTYTENGILLGRLLLARMHIPNSDSWSTDCQYGGPGR